uniref:Uncharacterized protein n=1 Tax=Arundo donax TaxID=35708 RepID=A0A0A9AD06_ARUDO
MFESFLYAAVPAYAAFLVHFARDLQNCYVSLHNSNYGLVDYNFVRTETCSDARYLIRHT